MALKEFIDQLLNDDQLKAAGHVLDCGTDWQNLQQALNDEPSGPPLDQTLLGGRALYHGDDRKVVLVRPDMVRIVAVALAEIEQDALGTSGELWETLSQIRSIYESAARGGCAMVFVTK